MNLDTKEIERESFNTKNYDTRVQRLIDSIRADIVNINAKLNDEEAMDLIELRILKDEWLKNFSFNHIERLIQMVFYSIRRDLSVLQPYIEDESISEIMVNGKDDIFIERNGIIEATDCKFFSTKELEEVIRRIASKVHREINELVPIVDARLEDGSRINGVYKNIAVNGPILTIRKFPKNRITMKKLVENETITEEVAEYLRELVVSGYNMFISGGTSSGKTTFLNALADYIPKGERVIVIEDSLELQISGVDNIVRLECKMANSQGTGSVPMASLIKTSLRMRPDRIIVGEVRDGTAFVQMLQAMNTGHDGSLSTGHGNSVEGMLRRLESLYLQETNFPIEAIQAQISQGIDIMIHLGRLNNGTRRLMEVCEIVGSQGGKITTNPIYVYKVGRGLVATGNSLINKDKINIMKGS